MGVGIRIGKNTRIYGSEITSEWSRKLIMDFL